jgi:hypothetical protein
MRPAGSRLGSWNHQLTSKCQAVDKKINCSMSCYIGAKSQGMVQAESVVTVDDKGKR